MAAILKMTADKIGKISMFSDFNENWYLGLFWSEELIGNDENCIQGLFYNATVSKMAANKIGKLLIVSEFYQPYLIYMPSLVEIPLAVSYIVRS
jgi:hypothetical protein